MPEPLSLSAATAAREAAHTAHENVLAEIKLAEAALASNAPAAAVAAGINLADASRAQVDAQHRLEFLHSAADETWRIYLESDAALNYVHTHSKWADKLSSAIATRIAAVQAREAALAACAKAEADYLDATATIEAAHAAGMPKPGRLHEHPLRLPHVPDHSFKISMWPSAHEIAFWEAAK